MSRFRVLIVLAAALSCLVLAPAAYAEDITWGGIATDDWDTLGNWNAFWDPSPTITQRVPIDGDTATLSDTELDVDGQFFSGREWGVLDVDDGTGVFSGNKTLVI